MDMDKGYNQSYKSKKKDFNFSVVHWNPEYVRKYPKWIGRKPKLLDPLEAKGFGMVTRWNRVTKDYDGSDKVLAIPNNIGVLGDPRRRRQNAASLPTIWALEENDPLPSVCVLPNPSAETASDSPPSHPN